VALPPVVIEFAPRRIVGKARTGAQAYLLGNLLYQAISGAAKARRRIARLSRRRGDY
jgi:hypothetical protein